jgi:hypothetical protein
VRSPTLFQPALVVWGELDPLGHSVPAFALGPWTSAILDHPEAGHAGEALGQRLGQLAVVLSRDDDEDVAADEVLVGHDGSCRRRVRM